MFAADRAPFYRGKQIVMLVASGAGGGYDTYARTLARYITKHIPGNPVDRAEECSGRRRADRRQQPVQFDALRTA